MRSGNGEKERGDKKRDVDLIVREEDKGRTRLDFWLANPFFFSVMIISIGRKIDFITRVFYGVIREV